MRKIVNEFEHCDYYRQKQVLRFFRALPGSRQWKQILHIIVNGNGLLIFLFGLRDFILSHFLSLNRILLKMDRI